jgi:cytochrome c553
MNRLTSVFALALLPVVAVATEGLPTWAFFFPDTNPPPSQTKNEMDLQALPGSTRSYTQAEINDLKNPPDWFPDQHPPMPEAVAKGGDGMLFACASCHLVSGMGHPESSSLAGLPASYMQRQINDFRSGARGNHVIVDGMPQMNGVQYMIAVANAVSDEDSMAATAYFARLKPIPWVRVIESATVPKSYVNTSYMRVAVPGADTEPLGERIVELPQDFNRQIMRDPRSGTVAYVPVGSVARGKRLGTNCAACHGLRLRGTRDVPAIAGRSPIYTFRQLYFFKDGSRKGPTAEPMTAAVANLTQGDMIAIAAYAASLAPSITPIGLGEPHDEQ